MFGLALGLHLRGAVDSNVSNPRAFGPEPAEFNRLLENTLSSPPRKSGYAALKKLAGKPIGEQNTPAKSAKRTSGAEASVTARDDTRVRIGSLKESERVQNTRDRKAAAESAYAQSNKTQVRMITVAFEYEGQRLDNYLMRELKGAPKSLVYRILRSGEVRVNSGRAKPDYRVKMGDVLRIPPIRLAEATAVAPASVSIEWLKGQILFEDKSLLVLNKPSGLASHGGSGLSYGAIEAMRALKPKDSLELVHRLDRDTSGLLLISKKRSLLSVLQTAMRDGEVTKRYQALMLGEPAKDRFEVNLPLLKNELAGGERIVKVSDEGKAARTFFTVLERFDGAFLVQAELGTGRTHQIRVHAQACGHPLAADPKYGDAAFNQRVKNLGLKRLFLHAVSVAWKQDGEVRSFQSELPEELQTVLRALRKGKA